MCEVKSVAQQHLNGNMRLREAWPKIEANTTELYERTEPASDEKAGLLAPEDKAKLDGIEEGAQVNQNAYAKVNGMEADNPSDEVTIEGGTGITVTQNPNEKKVTITATGEATPGPHGSAHLEFGSDPIPYATTTEGGLMSAEDKQSLEALEGLPQEVTELKAYVANKNYSKPLNTLKPLVTFYVDDGHQADYDVVLPKSSSLGIPLTTCLYNTSPIVSTPGRLKELVEDHGWEIHGHSTDGLSLKGLPYEEQLSRMKQNKEFFENLGYTVEGICYPIGEYDAATLRAARELFQVGMASLPGINRTPISTYTINRYNTDNYDLPTLKSLVDKIIADDQGWIVFYTHPGQFASDPTKKDKFFEIMDYVVAQGVEVVTCKEAMEIYENPIDIGDMYGDQMFFRLGADGLFDSSGLPIVLNTNNSNINDRPGTEFTSGRITINRFGLGAASDIPFDFGVGTLITDRSYEARQYVGTIAKQIFIGHQGAMVTRYFNSATGWSPWVTAGALNIVKTKNYTAASPITDFPPGMVTRVTFISGQAPDFPDGGIGTLEVNRLSQNDILNFQIWYPYNSDKFYRRRWTASGWAAWSVFEPSVSP